MNTAMTAPALTARQAAAFLGVEPNTLAKWRWGGSGPKYSKLGGSQQSRVRYRMADLEAFAEGQTNG